jgi:chromosome segregation ATPase
MSGRKASEVNTLLRNGESTRSASMHILESACENMKHAVESADKKGKSVYREIKKMNFTVSDLAKAEFPDASGKLEEECRQFVKKNTTIEVSCDDKEYTRILKEYEDVDEEADKVRKDLKHRIQSQGRSDPWYCDEEYARAREVQKKYCDLSNRVNELNGEYSGAISQAKAAETRATERMERAQKLQKEIADIEDKANKIQELRKKASEARSEIETEYSNIDKSLARKFIGKKYDALGDKVKAFSKQNDNDVINQCTEMMSEITELKNEFAVEYGKYRERQKITKSQIDAIFDRINHKVYSNPEDEFRNIKTEDMKLYSIMEFLQEYCKDEELLQKIKSEMNNINELFKKDNFDEADKHVEDLAKVINDASALCTKAHENKMKTIYTMLSIKQAMLELNYDVSVKKNLDIDDSYCIECSAGDECIKFDKVAVVDEGQPVIQIDHKEATTGTCAASWHDIRQRLSEEDLFIEDITKNGVSIHKPVSGTQTNREQISVTQNI